ncbi:hypothetical protein VP150E351_P0163 [Vibrio phage 150E35-1]|nr:hypothetical protein VP150E351_P0163 [Vibrio phage 150E35-1]
MTSTYFLDPVHVAVGHSTSRCFHDYGYMTQSQLLAYYLIMSPCLTIASRS